MTGQERLDFLIYLIVFLGVLFLLLLQLIVVRFKKKIFIDRAVKNRNKFIKFLKIIIHTVKDLEYNKSWINESFVLLNSFKKNYIRTEKSRVHIAYELLNLHRVLTGTAAKRLEDIYYYLGLDKTGIVYLRKNKSKLHTIVIRDFAQMHVTWALPEIKKLLSHKDETVRAEALIATLQLGDIDIVAQTELMGDISDWHKLKIVEAAKHLNINNLPNLQNALHSKSDLVVELALNLFDFHNIEPEEEIIIKHLNSNNNRIIKLCVPIVIYSNKIALIDELFKVFNQISDDDFKVYILKEIKAINNKLLIDHLMNIVYDIHFSDTVRLEALRSAIKIANKHNINIELKEDSIDKNKLHKMYKHATNRYI